MFHSDHSKEIKSESWQSRAFYFQSLILSIISLAWVCLYGTVNAQSIPIFTISGYTAETLDVSIFDAKLAKDISLNVQLIAPSGPQPWHTVVLPSNCTGKDDHFWKIMTPALINRGYAVVLLDSFSPRGFSTVCSNKFQMWQEARVVDAIAVLKKLRSDSRIDGSKIALGGHSNGALTAFMTSFVDSSQVVKTDSLGFAAYFAVGASCELTFKRPKLWAPLLLISGEKDDYTFPEPCRAEASRLQDAGSNVTIKIIPGANHEMSTTGWFYSSQVQRMPEGLPRMYMLGRDASGTLHLELEDGRKVTAPEMIKAYGGFLLSKTRGGTVGGPWDKFPEVSASIFEHLENAGLKPR